MDSDRPVHVGSNGFGPICVMSTGNSSSGRYKPVRPNPGWFGPKDLVRSNGPGPILLIDWVKIWVRGEGDRSSTVRTLFEYELEFGMRNSLVNRYKEI